MKLSNIHSKYLIQELFGFIKEKKKLKIIKYNLFLINKLDLSILDYKIAFFKNIIENYNCIYIKDYYENFKNDFNKIFTKEEELKELLLNCLSKIQNFNLRLSDEYFNLMINNSYFKENIRINMDELIKENIPKIMLIKNNELTEKAIKTFKEIYNLFSTNETMNKIQFSQLLSLIDKKEVNINDDRIKNLFMVYNINNDGLLLFEEFLKYYFDSIVNNINDVWNNLYSLGYNILLEKNKKIDYDFILNNTKEFEKNSIFSVLYKISKEKIYSINLSMSINKIFIQLLNRQEIFKNIKKINLSISNLNKMIELKIICLNTIELNLNIIHKELKYKTNELFNTFPNIIILNIYIKQKKINLFDLLKNLEDSKVRILKIFIFNYDNNIHYKFNSRIILEKIKNLEININEGNKNDFLFQFFNNVELPYLKQYILKINSNIYINQKLKLNKSDFNCINNFLVDTFNNTNQFNLNTFFILPNTLKLIRYFELNSKQFCYIYSKRREIKYLFKFILYNEDEFRKYYSNIDLSINKEEIIKYKKIDIKGIKYNNNLKEIIEKNDINLCDIYLNLNLNQYIIKSFKNLRSLYCEKEINIHDLLIIIKNQKGNFYNLKYINLTLNKIIISDNNPNYQIFKNLIQYSKNLKSLILKLHPYNFNKNINFFLRLVENLKKLKVLNISQNTINTKYDIDLEKVLDKFPKLKEKKYYFNIFKIGDKVFISKEKNIENIKIEYRYEIKNEILMNEIKLFGNNEKISKNSEIYINNKKINWGNNKYLQIGNYLIQILFKEKIKNTKYMFCECSSITFLDLSNFNTNNIYNMNHMFSGCSSLTFVNLSNFNTNNVEDMSYLFYGCSNLNSLDLSNFNTNKVTDMSCIFSNCSSLISLNLSNFNTYNVKNMTSIFSGCSSLTSLNLSNFNTSNVTNMRYMFYNCSSLISLNLNNFNTYKVEDMNSMFNDCSSLTSLNLSNFITENVIDMSFMFSGCSSLSSLNLSNFNTNKVNNFSCMFYNCVSLNSLNLSINFNSKKDMSNIFFGLKKDCKIISN